MHLIAYTSVYVGSDIKGDIDCIADSSKKNNPRLEIKGVMFFQQGRFLQFIEGEEAHVRSLMEKIAADSRHTDVKYLFDDPIEDRGLAQWNMDCFQLGESQALELDYLKMIRDGYRKVLKVDTKAIVDLYKGFVNHEC